MTRKSSIVMVILVLALPRYAVAADESQGPPDNFIKYVRYSVRYDVNPDATHVETYEAAMKVLAQQGIPYANKASISFSESMQQAEILAAYTLKSDGRRIDAPPSNYQKASNTGEGTAAPMFSDLATKWIVFPEVEVGDTVVFSYRLTQKEALIPGNFSMAQWFSKFQVIEDADVTVTAPRSLTLHVQARDVEGGAVENGESDRQTWHWTFRNREVGLPEPGAVSPMDYGPLIVASTFDDYGQLAAAYERRARPKVVVSDRIRQLASEVVKDATTPRERAEALHRWVTKNIRFAGNCVGNGGIVPHDSDSVLSNRMGDCKDHTVLLQALLSAQGIESTPVLVNSGPAYTLPEVPAIGAFNHVIAYIPSLDVYVDPTAEHVAFGTLPPAEYDKPVLHTASFDHVRRTPRGDYKRNYARATTTVAIAADGSADGETHIEVHGAFAGGSRDWLDHVQPRMEDVVMRTMLSRSGYTGSGTILRDDTSQVEEHHGYGGRYHVDDVINVDGPGAITIKTPLPSTGAIASLLTSPSEPPRTVNYGCYGGSSIEQVSVALPPTVKVLAIPHDVNIDGARATYAATYRQDGNKVDVVREIEDRTPDGTCTPADQVAGQQFARAVLKDLRAQVIYVDVAQGAAR